MIGEPFNYQALRKFRLRTTLVVPFVLQIAAAVGVVGFISFQAGRTAVNDLASQLRNEVTNRIQQKLTHYLDTPSLINQLNAGAVAIDEVDITAADAVLRHFWSQIQLFPTANYISFGTVTGDYLSIDRLEENDTLRVVIANTTTDNDMHIYNTNAEGDRTERAQVIPDYDPRIRPWYQAAVESRMAAWSAVHTYFTDSMLAINYSRPLYDANDRLLGVFTNNLGLAEIGDFLREIEISDRGQAFILERSGEVVASSTLSEPFTLIDDEVQRISAMDSEDPLLRTTVAQLQNEFGTLDAIRASQQLTFQVTGERQFVQVTPLADVPELDWLIIVAIPEADFMGQINANTRNTLLLSLGALSLAIAIGILTARWITRPILRISHASDSLAQGDLDQHVVPSSILEINTLAHSFNSMSGQLKDSFTTLEQKNEELRLAEENYRSIFENALEGIFQSSPEGQFISVNPALARIYGYDSPQDMIEGITNIGEQVYVDPEQRSEFKKLLANQDMVKDFEYRCYCKDGSIIWTQIDARAVKDSNGNLLYYEGIVQDITERKRREDELRRQLAELKIEIDQKKRRDEVATLTTSTYFQEVQQEISDVNLDEFWS
ncbi:MAG: PAS domain S-box protein [Leptolyngbya sp. SIO1D8]|nr:PAS domain S-box protein [Leptolyngbya sp. SIO1D8]